MKRSENENGTPCVQPGCTGRITNTPELSVQIQTSCCGGEPALACPICGRLHYANGRHAVQSRSFESVFLVDGQLENRPFNSVERLQAVEQLRASHARKDLIERYYADKFGVLLALGHAADCSANAGTGPCVCGQDKVETWIDQHLRSTSEV